jgi:cbb3-type cytochrome oxidase maturation protein
MLAASGVLILLSILVGIVGFGFLVWGLLNGQFDELEAQAMVPLDEEDLRLLRPWETPSQCEQRVRDHGTLLQARDSDWGGRL